MNEEHKKAVIDKIDPDWRDKFAYYPDPVFVYDWYREFDDGTLKQAEREIGYD